MNYSLLKQLLEALESFEENKASTQAATLPQFVAYLNQLVAEPRPLSAPEEQESIEGLLAQHLTYLYRFAKHYSKKALAGSDLTTLDDFGYLAGIWRWEGITKSDIIERNIHEKTSGTEIIKRLLRQGYIRQENALNDRRSRQLYITDTGKGILFSTFEAMRKAGQLVSGPLDNDEKLQLLYLLQKLDAFHNPLFREEKEKSLDELHEALSRLG